MHQCTQATLLAGFAFAQLTGYEYDDPDEGFFTTEQLDAMGIGHTIEDASQRGVAGWSWLTWTKQILQVSVYQCTKCSSTLVVSRTTRSKQLNHSEVAVVRSNTLNGFLRTSYSRTSYYLPLTPAALLHRLDGGLHVPAAVGGAGVHGEHRHGAGPCAPRT